MKSDFQRQLWVSFGLVFGAIIVASAAVYFLSNDLTAQASAIIADKTFAQDQTAALGVLASLESDAPHAAEYTAAMNKLLPTHDQLFDFSGWAAGLATSHNVSASVSFQGGNALATASAPGSDGFSITATGAPADLNAFISDLEHASGYLVAIDSFGLASNDSGYQLSVQGRVFSR